MPKMVLVGACLTQDLCQDFIVCNAKQIQLQVGEQELHTLLCQDITNPSTYLFPGLRNLLFWVSPIAVFSHSAIGINCRGFPQRLK